MCKIGAEISNAHRCNNSVLLYNCNVIVETLLQRVLIAHELRNDRWVCAFAVLHSVWDYTEIIAEQVGLTRS